jgi:hypothetical protein
VCPGCSAPSLKRSFARAGSSSKSMDELEESAVESAFAQEMARGREEREVWFDAPSSSTSAPSSSFSRRARLYTYRDAFQLWDTAQAS